MHLSGKLLVALPVLVDRNFDRTVVYVVSHDDEAGAVGLVLNRPSATPVADALPQWAEQVAAPGVVFVGGPVQTDMAIALADDGRGVDTIDLDGDPALLPAGTVRVFAGYAGWSPGQVEGELGEGAWAVCDSDPHDPFADDPEELWYDVLRRQRGELRRLALLPEDVSVN